MWWSAAVLTLSLLQATARGLPCFLSLPSAVSTRLDGSAEPQSRRREEERAEDTEAPQLTSSRPTSSWALLTRSCPRRLRQPGRDQHPSPLAESSPQNPKRNRWRLLEALSPGVPRDTAGPPLHVPSSTLRDSFLRHHCGTWEVGVNSSKSKHFLKSLKIWMEEGKGNTVLYTLSTKKNLQMTTNRLIGCTQSCN